jgi:hypothetical protein
LGFGHHGSCYNAALWRSGSPWTSDDALNALRGRSVWGWAAFQFILLLALLFLVGIDLIDHEFEFAGWMWLAASAVFALAAYEIPRIQVRRALGKNPSAQGETVFRCDNTGTVSTYSTGASRNSSGELIQNTKRLTNYSWCSSLRLDALVSRRG